MSQRESMLAIVQRTAQDCVQCIPEKECGKGNDCGAISTNGRTANKRGFTGRVFLGGAPSTGTWIEEDRFDFE
jgi:hypothetical protein